MEKLGLLYYPDKRLYVAAKPVAKIDGELKDVVEEMFDILYKTNGVGLAGNQVGYPFRVVVANMTADPTQKNLSAPSAQAGKQEVFINPEIIKTSGQILSEEACLSLPDIITPIKRAQRVTVRFYTLEGEEKVVEADELYARMFQHEVDHLDGVLILDRMTSAEKQRCRTILKQLQRGLKMRKKGTYVRTPTGL